MKERLLVGLDLGSSSVRVAIGQLTFSNDQRSVLNIIGVTEIPSCGISKGCISSLEDVVSSVSGALEQSERLVGVPIQEAYVGIGGTHINSKEAKGVIGVSRPDGDIRAEDVARALESARAFINPANQEILHVLPREFSVDGQGGIKDPIGMQGIRLEAEVQVIQGLLSHIRNITKAVFRTGLDIAELVYAPLAAAESVTQPRQRELGVCVLIIGSTTTGMAVYEDGELLYASTLPIGADHITSDIAIGLRISLDVAENIKRSHGHSIPSEVDSRDQIDLKDFGADQGEIVSLQYVSEIIEARVEELYEKVEEELKKIDRSGMLPAGVVLTGGGAKLPGMVELGKRILHLPCSVGYANVQTSMPELALDPTFSTSVGLVLWGHEAERQSEVNIRRSWSDGKNKGGRFFSKISNPVKRVFKSFIP
ncbi:MAG: cell division protein FtsA [Patescibacteria group bacterium]|nr:cell division protein FtsA [Patescibacteria group bacterium]